MKRSKHYVISGLILFAFLTSTAQAQDMRQAQVQVQAARQQLEEKAAAEKRAAEEEAAASRATIAKNRHTLQSAIDALESQHRQLSESVAGLEKDLAALTDKEKDLTQQLAETDGVLRELVGVIRTNAKDLASHLQQNLQTAIVKPDTLFLDKIAGEAAFPELSDVRKMVSLLHTSTQSSGEVSLQSADIVDRAGRTVQADVLQLGNFTAAYRLVKEVGFLNYAPAGRKLYALSRLPSRTIRKGIAAYLSGQSEAVPMDISRGAAIRQLTHQLRLWQQIPKGGPIVWPILAILAIGVVIVIERIVFLWRKRLDVDKLIGRISEWAAEHKWELCQKACRMMAKKPLARIVAAGLECRQLPREEMENVLQEAILRELPAMERFMSTLGMLAAIAPLLGLLGTVTGMINTFHVITQHGTGDPRLMSGGISEALVTTMLGLAVAIPIMLAHTLLNRSVDKLVGQMEEKAVALVNIVHRASIS